METKDIAAMIDHTMLKPQTKKEDIERICQEASEYSFATACVNPCWVSLASSLLKDAQAGVTTVIGFPLGATFPSVKAAETREAIAAGADEIDMVLSIGQFLSGNIEAVREDIKAVREACSGHTLKVILETCLLNEEQIAEACRISADAGADFVKTSTGFASGGATPEAVRIMRETVGPDLGVKASGGVRSREDALAMIEAGASRIGASSGVSICQGEISGESY